MRGRTNLHDPAFLTLMTSAGGGGGGGSLVGYTATRCATSASIFVLETGQTLSSGDIVLADDGSGQICGTIDSESSTGTGDWEADTAMTFGDCEECESML